MMVVLMKSTFEIVKSALIYVLKNISILKNQQNAILEISGDQNTARANQMPADTYRNTREKLMVICFSPLSSWVLFIGFLMMYLNPWRYALSISQIHFLGHFVTHYFFSNDAQLIIIVTFALFVISFFMKAEFILIGLLAFLISNGDLHLRNALIFLPMIILGRLFLHIKLIRLLNAEPRRTWSIICTLFFAAWTITTWITLNSFQFLSDQGLFSSSMHFLRFEVFAISTFTYYFMEFLILSIWGHFYCLRLGQ